MKIQQKRVNFKSIDCSRLGAMAKLHVGNPEQLEDMSKNVEVILKDTKHKFPYRKTFMDVNSIKIIARKKGLNFIEKLLGYHTVVDYFPIGNLRNLIKFKFKGDFTEFFKKTIAKVR